MHADRTVSEKESAFLTELASQMALPEGEAKMIVLAIEALNRDSLDS